MILHNSIPFDVIRTKALPGISPLNPSDWLLVDEAYNGQMAERRRLLETHTDQVHALLPAAQDAASELLEMVLGVVRSKSGFEVTSSFVRCPDGAEIALDRSQPLLTLGQIVQDDFCLLTHDETQESVLTGAVLCFPASWQLSEKIGRPLTGVHEPVPEYTPVAARVQRLFDGIQTGKLLWRFNVLWYEDPALFQPRSANARRAPTSAKRADFIRSERQCMLRLPQSRAVVFSIHTYVMARAQYEAEFGSQP